MTGIFDGFDPDAFLFTAKDRHTHVEFAAIDFLEMVGDNRKILTKNPLYSASTVRAIVEKAKSVPGWMLVPIEPTEEMIKAAIDAADEKPLSGWGRVVLLTEEETYKAMLEAAPKPEGE